MEEDEKYWSNLEKIFVHNVYERISSKYDELLHLSQIKHQTDTNTDVNDSTSRFENRIIMARKKSELEINKKEKKDKNGTISNRKNEWPKVRLFLLQIEPYSLIGKFFS